MKMVVGLGNPGREYESSRHNVGFFLLDALQKNFDSTDWKKSDRELISETRILSEKILLVKPQTFMNLSGESVVPLVNFYKLPLENLIVVHDDMDLPVGKIRIRAKSNSGGHHGIDSIISLLGTNNFPRVKIGIGHPHVNRDVVSHVLSTFDSEEKILIDQAVENLIPAVKCIITDGIDIAMNRFNPKKKKIIEEESIEAEL